MGLFSRKKRVQLEEFCREFYDKYVLNPVKAGVDVGEINAETVRRSIAEVDGGFAVVDSRLFRAEMTLIHFEVFGLAWFHQLGDKHAAAQSAFTKRYLEGRDRTDLWDALEPYNQAAARSSRLGRTSDTASGRAHLAFINTTRADLFDRWYEQGFEGEAVARAASRFGTEAACKQGLTAGFLMLTLCQRLGCEVNKEGQFRLAATIRGLYDGARETLKAVRIEPNAPNPNPLEHDPRRDAAQQRMRNELGRLQRDLELLDNPETIFSFGQMSFDGDGVERDYVAAAGWFQIAAEQGHAKSQHNLALMYESGQGVPHDFMQAAKWYRIAAEQGHAGSQNNLGALFESGDGVAQDYVAAIAWYQRAAEGGDANAASNLHRLRSRVEVDR